MQNFMVTTKQSREALQMKVSRIWRGIVTARPVKFYPLSITYRGISESLYLNASLD